MRNTEAAKPQTPIDKGIVFIDDPAYYNAPEGTAILHLEAYKQVASTALEKVKALHSKHPLEEAEEYAIAAGTTIEEMKQRNEPYEFCMECSTELPDYYQTIVPWPCATYKIAAGL